MSLKSNEQFSKFPVVEFTEYMIHDLFLENNLQLEKGYLTVPNKPGLGVVIDEGEIDKYKIDS